MRSYLPHTDPEPAKRTASLTRARAAYQYDYETIPTVAMLRRMSRGEVPSFRWIRGVLKVVGGVLFNDVRAASSFARRRHGTFGPVYGISRWAFLRFGTLLRATRVVTLRSVARALRLKDEDALNRRISAEIPDRTGTRGRLLNTVVLDEPMDIATDIEDFARLFSRISLPALAQSWTEDSVFARLRVAGPNPVAIERAKAGWNTRFPVNTDMFRRVAGFEDDDLATAEAQHRLYLVDYKRLIGVEAGANNGRQKFSYAPKALFAIPVDRRHGNLLPIAIQCQQEPDPEALFTPEHGVAWKMAKTVVNIADTNQHGFVAHLAHTHLIMEAFVLATPRQLSNRHPLHRLLMPHLEATAFINFVATQLLLAPSGSVDQLFCGTLDASTRVAIAAAHDDFNDLMLPRDLAARGVESPELDYPYRDDATAVWTAIREWVEDYLAVYYTSDDDVARDVELAAWARELVSETGGRLRGFGEDGAGVIATREYLYQVCTMLIFTASAQHAAVNFPQRSIMAYAPILPMGGYAPAPRGVAVLHRRRPLASLPSARDCSKAGSRALRIGRAVLQAARRVQARSFRRRAGPRLSRRVPAAPGTHRGRHRAAASGRHRRRTRPLPDALAQRHPDEHQHLTRAVGGVLRFAGQRWMSRFLSPDGVAPARGSRSRGARRPGCPCGHGSTRRTRPCSMWPSARTVWPCTPPGPADPGRTGSCRCSWAATARLARAPSRAGPAAAQRRPMPDPRPTARTASRARRRRTSSATSPEPWRQPDVVDDAERRAVEQDAPVVEPAEALLGRRVERCRQRHPLGIPVRGDALVVRDTGGRVDDLERGRRGIDR